MLVNVFLIWIFLQVSFRWRASRWIQNSLSVNHIECLWYIEKVKPASELLPNCFFFQVLFQGFTFKQSSDEKKKEAGVRLIIKWRFSHNFNQPGWIYPVREGEMQCCPEKKWRVSRFSPSGKKFLSWVTWPGMSLLCRWPSPFWWGTCFVMFFWAKYFEIFKRKILWDILMRLFPSFPFPSPSTWNGTILEMSWIFFSRNELS